MGHNAVAAGRVGLAPVTGADAPKTACLPCLCILHTGCLYPRLQVGHVVAGVQSKRVS